MAVAFIASKSTTQDQDAAGGDDLEFAVRLLGVVVDLDRQGRVAVERALGEAGGSSRPRRPSATGPSRRSPATGPRIVPVRMPGSAAGRTWSRTICHRVAPRARAAWRSDWGTARSASWVVITMIGRISRLSVRTPGQQRRPQRQALDPEGPHEQSQPEDAVDDRRHARQVGDVGLDDPPQPARRGILLEVDRRADADRDADHGDQAQQPETAGDPDPVAGARGIASTGARRPACRSSANSSARFGPIAYQG